eukprot:Seg5376.1 transcript_id=Seg5376.1/GoldUCD/mRNA.D3Y31 product="Short-wave-sensitive opsin 1" protein_id=Seg5376.1/GoldUCD/D3Y31
MSNSTICLQNRVLPEIECEHWRKQFLALGIFNTIYAGPVIILNAMFILTVILSKTLHSLPNYLLLTLSITDFLHGAVTQIPYAVQCIIMYHGGDPGVVETFVPYAGYALGQVSFITLGTVSFERYLAIVHPFIYQRISKRHFLMAAISVSWFIPVLVTLITIGRSFRMLLGLLLLQVFLGWLLTFFCYIKIILAIKNLLNRDKQRRSSQNRQSGEEECRGVSTVAIILLAVVLSYTPFIICSIYLVVRNKDGAVQMLTVVEFVLLQWSQVITMLNSGLNPIIYYFRLTGVRREFMKLFPIKKRRRKVGFGENA